MKPFDSLVDRISPPEYSQMIAVVDFLADFRDRVLVGAAHECDHTREAFWADSNTRQNQKQHARDAKPVGKHLCGHAEGEDERDDDECVRPFCEHGTI